MKDELWKLPKGWRWERLSRIAVDKGATVNSQSGKIYDYISLENIESNTGKLVHFSPTEGSLIKSTKVAFHKGDILYGKLRPYLNKVWVATFDGIATTEILILRCNLSEGVPSYLAYFLRGPQFLATVSRETSGSRMPRVTSGFLKENAYVPLPPLFEQERIVSKLDQLFAHIDRAIALLEENLRLSEQLMASVLDEVFRGAGKRWGVMKLENILKVKSGEFLPSSDMTNTGEYEVFGGNGVAGTHSTCNAKGENIIIGRVGANCGNIHYVEKEIWVTDNALVAILLDTTLNKRYLALALEHLSIGQFANQAAQPVISYKLIRSLEIPVPPPPTQQKAANQILNYKAKISALSKSYLDQISSLRALKTSLLDRAFRGEL